jgi:Asp-tRNA(Asn)/Glu-tRNA(Gln) amidotransferase A subunit family amidase
MRPDLHATRLFLLAGTSDARTEMEQSIASVAPGDERGGEFFRINALLLRNPSVVNMLDGCAISVPCHAPGELPVGVMLWHAPLRDDAVLAVARQAGRVLEKQQRPRAPFIQAPTNQFT